MQESQAKIQITHNPRGDKLIDDRILHLMPDGSVIGNYFGPTVLSGGYFTCGYIRLAWKDEYGEEGYLDINNKQIQTSVGNYYSGSSYGQDIPVHKQASVAKWMEKFN